MNLQQFFEENKEVAIAFSGGVDSAYLLYAAKKYAKRVTAIFVKSQFQPEFELDDAKRLAEQLSVDLKILFLDALADEKVVENPPNRCYYCKKIIFSNILNKAKQEGYSVIIDGTNASDDCDDRPGMKALEEMKVLSPLRICGITKQKVRELSKEAGLFTHDKPSYACLATRIATGDKITEENLKKVEYCEERLFSMGFSDFRIRVFHGAARLQLKSEQFEMAINKREQILDALGTRFSEVLLDLNERK